MNIYTTYARIENGAVVEYPVNPRVTLASTGDFNVPWNWGGGELDGKTYVYCHDKKPWTTHEEVAVETGVPYFDAEMQLWYRGYEVQPATAEVVAQRYADADSALRRDIETMCSDYSDARAQELGLSDSQRADWASFRDALQSVFTQPGYPFSYDWPHVPEATENRTTLEVVRV